MRRCRWNLRRWGIGLAVPCTALALMLPMHGLEPFLPTPAPTFVLARLTRPGDR